jgi:hypothetical protein
VLWLKVGSVPGWIPGNYQAKEVQALGISGRDILSLWVFVWLVFGLFVWGWGRKYFVDQFTK